MIDDPFWNWRKPLEHKYGSIENWPIHELENIIMTWEMQESETIVFAIAELKRREIRCRKDL